MEDRVLVVDLTGVAPFDSGCCSRALLLGVFDGHAGECFMGMPVNVSLYK